MKYTHPNLWCALFAFMSFCISIINIDHHWCFLFLIIGFCIITYDVARVRTHNKLINKLVEP